MHYIISPHIDDAVLSLGGFLSDFVREETTQVINVFTISRWTNPSVSGRNIVPSKEAVTKMRKREENKVSRLIGYVPHHLDFEDSSLRNVPLNEDLKIDIIQAILNIVSFDDVLIFPLGLLHPDHQFVGEIGMEFLDESYNVIFYEDQPYVATSHGSIQRSHLTSSKNLEPIAIPIKLQNKIGLMKEYRSQMSDEWIDMVSSYALSQHSLRPVERLWKPAYVTFTSDLLK